MKTGDQGKRKVRRSGGKDVRVMGARSKGTMMYEYEHMGKDKGAG